MARLPRSSFAPLAFILLVGCTSRSPAAGGARDAVLRPDPQFATEEQKLLACLDLQDHIVDLFATDYVAREGVTLTLAEQTAFRNGWAEQLAKRGAFDHFEQACFGALTPRKYHCGMHSQTTGSLFACITLRPG